MLRVMVQGAEPRQTPDVPQCVPGSLLIVTDDRDWVTVFVRNSDSTIQALRFSAAGARVLAQALNQAALVLDERK